MDARDAQPPAGAAVARVRHRVPFYETDAMGIVHHSNYVRYLELARVRWMDEHHRPYRDYVAEGLHFATTRVELDYRRPVAFDEEIEIATWLEWVRGASLRMGYAIRSEAGAVARGGSEHALVDARGRVRRLPAERRRELAHLGPPAQP